MGACVGACMRASACERERERETVYLLARAPAPEEGLEGCHCIIEDRAWDHDPSASIRVEPVTVISV